jgi:hypothetical protein
MRGFVHQAVVAVTPGGDHRAPGAAVTARLCGHWEHEGPCRGPHHNAVAARDGDRVTIRTVFASPPHEEAAVRGDIAEALAVGHLPTGRATTWVLLDQGPAEPDLAERDWISRRTAR